MAVRREGGDVIRGVKAGWFGFVVCDCDGAAGGEMAGDEYEDDMIAVIEEGRPKQSSNAYPE